YPVAGYCNRRNGGFYLTCYEIFRSYSDAAPSVVLDAADGEAVVARPGIAIAIKVIDISVIRIHTGVIHPPKAGVKGAKICSRLRTVGIGHDDPTSHPI